MASPSISRRAGFGHIALIIVLVVVLLATAIGIVVYGRSDGKNNTATPGSSNPSTQRPTATPPQQQTNSYVGMTQYTNAAHSMSFYYPTEWRIEELDSNTTYLEPVELSLALVTTTTEGTSTVAMLAVSTKSLSEVGPAGDVDPKYRQELTVKGKQAVRYSIPQSPTVNREMYYIAAGGKTYWLQTFNEEANVIHIPDYTTKFNKLVESLALP